MDWLCNLFQSACPFCGIAIGRPTQACNDCVQSMIEMEAVAPLTGILEGPDAPPRSLPYLASFGYQQESWIQRVIFRQKQNPNPWVTKWLAHCLWSKSTHLRTSSLLHDCYLVWIPASPLRPPHLVERLAIDLNLLGFSLLPRPLLSSKFFLFRNKRQKERSLKERLQAPSPFSVFRSQAKTDVVLLDDVITTGTTLLAAKKAIENGTNYRVVLAIALAYTIKTTQNCTLGSNHVTTQLI